VCARAQVLAFARNDPKLKTLDFSHPKHAGWLRLVIMEERRFRPAERAAAEAAPAQRASPRVAAPRELPEVTAIRTHTLMDMLKVDGTKKHKRFFSVNPEAGTITWAPSVKSRGEGRGAGKTETLSAVTGTVTTWSHTTDRVLPARYVERVLIVHTVEGTRLMMCAKTPEDKAAWVTGCEAVLAGDLRQRAAPGRAAQLGEAASVSWSPDASQVAIGFCDATVSVFATRGWELRQRLTAASPHSDSISSLRWSPRGNMLAVASWDCSVSVLSTSSWEVLTKVDSVHRDVITALSWYGNATFCAILY
jgi:WD40 repeat protein